MVLASITSGSGCPTTTHFRWTLPPSATVLSFNGDGIDGLVGSKSLAISESDVSFGNKPLTDTWQLLDASPCSVLTVRL